MKLYKEDLKKIGHTVFESCGNLLIICDGPQNGICHILLREILALTGHKIVEEGDYMAYNDETCDWYFETDYPWDKYCEL